MKKLIFYLIVFLITPFAIAQDNTWSGGGGGTGSVDDTAYNATTWDGVTDKAPSQNAVRDKIETLAGGHDAVTLDANADELLSLSTQELGFDTQSANTILAGPDAGGDAVPAFRALVAADIPDISLSYWPTSTDLWTEAENTAAAYLDQTAADLLYLPLQTVGIANDNLLEIDDADAANGDILYLTANGAAGYNEAEFKTAYNMEAGTDYQAYSAVLGTWAGITPGANVGTWIGTPTIANFFSALTGEASGVQTFLTTPSSANLFSLVTDEGAYMSTMWSWANAAAAKSALGYYTAGDTLQTNSSTSLPGTCTVGEMYVDTDADTNGSLYICIAENSWKEVDDDGGAGGGGDLLADGTVPLTANWDVGAYYIQGTRFISDIATGTAPFGVSSTTLVSNLNADLLDGNEASAFQTTLTNSAGLAGALSDETGSGVSVFGTSPTFTTSMLLTNGFVFRPALGTDDHNYIFQAYGSGGLTNALVIQNNTGSALPDVIITANLSLPTIDTLSFNDSGYMTLSDNNSIRFDAAPDSMDDGEYNGEVITGINFGATVTAISTVFLQSDGKVDDANATQGTGLYPAFGLAVNAGDDTDAAIILVKGVVRDEDWTGLTVGGPVYLGETAGTITQTAPSTSNDCVQVIGRAISDSEIYFDFDNHYLLVE
jgi:hypothetical protein